MPAFAGMATFWSVFQTGVIMLMTQAQHLPCGTVIGASGAG